MSSDQSDHGGNSSIARLFTDRNTWRTARSDGLGWVVDGEEYFRALRESLEAARYEILIVGWDIDSRTELVRDEDHPHFPSRLASTLESLVDRKPGLCIRVLSWDFALVYVLERQLMPARAFGWQNSDRLRFELDGNHASGASHHQKIVVIDGALAYSGGLDLTKCRWDTRAHARDEPRRCDPDAKDYRPFHDVQAIVSGAPAAALRDLVDSRWLHATGEGLSKLDHEPDGDEIWPDGVPVRARDIEVAIARTWTGADGKECIEEVKQLYLDTIAEAKDCIYIENQYLTSTNVADALAARLHAEGGPEVVIVLPGETSGWLEQATMEVLRNRAIEQLRQSDRYGRLRVFAPVSEALGDVSINVHSKLMVTDRRYGRIGSANLSGRSMGLDSECDLIFDDPDAATELLADLLSEHLEADFDAVAGSLVASGLIETIDRFNGKSRRLEPLEIESGKVENAVLEPVAKIADLEKPIRSATNDQKDNAGSGPSIAGWLFLAAIGAGIAVAVYGVVHADNGDFSLKNLLAAARRIADHPLAPLAVPPAMLVGSFVFAPVTGMIALCALIFDPWVAAVSAILGTLLATAVNHWLGAHFHGALMNRIPDSITDKILSIASSSDVLALAGLRLVPIAPFTAVNLVVGASGVRLTPFLLGTAIAMTPGILLIALSVDRARAALLGESLFDPWIVAGIAAAGAATVALRIWKNAREVD